MQKELRSIKDANVNGKRFVVRADLDVPMQNGAVADDSRLRALVPTLELLAQNGAKEITVIGHLGRPEGKVVEELKLAPVEKRLRELTAVAFTVRENVRFDPREEANDAGFAQELASFGDVYVNDAFANCHRAHASMVGVAKLLPSFAGLNLLEEVKHMQEALEPAHPAFAIIGGAKFETKEPLLAALASVYDQVLVGGVLGNDLLRARGTPVGSSRVADKVAPTELAVNKKLVAPEDITVVQNGAEARPANTADVRAQESIVDIGPRTAEAWSAYVSKAQFVLWNGPVGLYEGGYAAGTRALAQAIASGTCRALVGGGDTIAAIREFQFDPARVFLSTGGGAMLQFLADGTLPALEALQG